MMRHPMSFLKPGWKAIPAIALGIALVSLGCSVESAESGSQTSDPAQITESSDPLLGAPVEGPAVLAETLPETVRESVLDAAAEDLNIPRADLGVMRYSQETWSDSCLGLGGPAESCLQVLIEGWQVEVTNGSQSWFYRTDATGETIRQSTLQSNLPPSVGDRVLEVAAAQTDQPVDQLSITAAEPQMWDGCMGIVEDETTVCTEIGILGWRATVTGGDRTWVYHTDGSGSDIRLNEAESSSSVQ